MFKILKKIETTWADGYKVTILLVRADERKAAWKLEGSNFLFSDTDELMSFYKGTIKTYKVVK